MLNNAFADIEISGEDVSEIRKVRIFLQGIQDRRLEAAKAAIMASEELEATFEAAANYVAQFMDKIKLTNAGPTVKIRNVSSAIGVAIGNNSKSNQPRGNFGGSQGGRFGGRLGGRGSFSKFSGRNSGRGGRNMTFNRPRAPAPRYYTDAEWQALTPEAQQTIRNEREQARRGINALAIIEDVARNVCPRIDTIGAIHTGDIPGDASAITPSSAGAATPNQAMSIGAMMSRRARSNGGN